MKFSSTIATALMIGIVSLCALPSEGRDAMTGLGATISVGNRHLKEDSPVAGSYTTEAFLEKERADFVFVKPFKQAEAKSETALKTCDLRWVIADDGGQALRIIQPCECYYSSQYGWAVTTCVGYQICPGGCEACCDDMYAHGQGYLFE